MCHRAERIPSAVCTASTEYGHIEHVEFPFQVQAVTGRRYLNAEHIFDASFFKCIIGQCPGQGSEKQGKDTT
jgi:hypothetical protein